MLDGIVDVEPHPFFIMVREKLGKCNNGIRAFIEMDLQELHCRRTTITTTILEKGRRRCALW